MGSEGMGLGAGNVDKQDLQRIEAWAIVSRVIVAGQGEVSKSGTCEITERP